LIFRVGDVRGLILPMGKGVAILVVLVIPFGGGVSGFKADIFPVRVRHLLREILRFLVDPKGASSVPVKDERVALEKILPQDEEFGKVIENMNLMPHGSIFNEEFQLTVTRPGIGLLIFGSK